MNKKVLIVDNDRDFLEELRETLLLSGYDLIAVDDPMDTVNIMEETDVDAVLLDLQMPGKSGFELAYELNSMPRWHKVPIIAMTGFYKDDFGALFKTCGIRQCLKKPFRPLDVIAGLEAVLK